MPLSQEKLLIYVIICRQDCVKEKHMQHKLEENGSSGHSALVDADRVGLALDFERSGPSRRLRLVLRELMRVMNKVVTIVRL